MCTDVLMNDYVGRGKETFTYMYKECKHYTTACRGYDTVSYNKRTRLIVPVLQRQSECFTLLTVYRNEGHEIHSCIHEKRQEGSDVRSLCQCSINHLCSTWGTRQEKGTVFESRWGFFGKNKN